MIGTGLARLKRKAQRLERETMERQELLARREDGAAMARQIDEESQLAASVQTSKTVLEEAFQTGTAILENMTGNRDVLKVTFCFSQC